MARKSDPAKLRQWTRRLKRFAKSESTVATFCRSEGVSVASFYQWKRKLTTQPGGKGRRLRRDQAVDQAKSIAFEPVRIVDPEVCTGVTVRLGDGIVVDLGHDASTIQRVVDQLLDRRSGVGA